ncbi:MAG: WxL domain-containing protein [Bacillota bacterium]
MKFIKLLLAGLVTVGTVFGTASAFAAEQDYNSIGKIEFEKQDSSPGPINPTDPEEEINIDDEPAPNPGTGGDLSIDYASHFNFGKYKISGNKEEYFAALKSGTNASGGEVTVPNYVQVSDNRGTNMGWTLSVKQDNQFVGADMTELAGAYISIYDVAVNGKNEVQYAPAPASDKIEIRPDGATHEIMSAEGGKGMGTWVGLFAEDKEGTNAGSAVSVTVPGETAKSEQEYITTLTWVLTDAE